MAAFDSTSFSSTSFSDGSFDFGTLGSVLVGAGSWIWAVFTKRRK